MILFLLFLLAAANSNRECYVVSCKSYLYFWESCKCVRETRNPVFVTVIDDQIAEPKQKSNLPQNALCVVFNYKQVTTSMVLEDENELIINMVIVQGVAFDDNNGKDYPPRVINLHRVSKSFGTRKEVLEIAQDEFPLGTIDNCFPEVADETERNFGSIVFAGEDFSA